jgi:hypothetical protein
MKFKIAPVCLGIIICLLLLSLGRAASDDQPKVTITKVQGKIPSKDAYILKYKVDTQDPNDYIPTGDLSIEYSDGTTVVEKIPPAQKSSDKETVFNEVGFSDVKVSSDKRTIGWTEVFENCCTSYPVPEVLAIYQSGETITHIQQGQMVWDWVFLDGSQHVSAVWGPTHGTDRGDYQLYDARTGHMLSEFFGEPADNSTNPEAPEWVKQTDRKTQTKNSKQK